MPVDAARKKLKRILKGCASHKKHKFGARHTGWQVVLPNGDSAYIFERRHHQIYRGGPVASGGFLTISEAMSSDAATWMIEHDVLRTLKKLDLTWVIIFTVDSGDMFMAPRSKWEDREITKDMNLAGYRDTVRHLGLHHMQHRNLGISI